MMSTVAAFAHCFGHTLLHALLGTGSMRGCPYRGIIPKLQSMQHLHPRHRLSCFHKRVSAQFPDALPPKYTLLHRNKLLIKRWWENLWNEKGFCLGHLWPFLPVLDGQACRESSLCSINVFVASLSFFRDPWLTQKEPQDSSIGKFSEGDLLKKERHLHFLCDPLPHPLLPQISVIGSQCFPGGPFIGHHSRGETWVETSLPPLNQTKDNLV